MKSDSHAASRTKSRSGAPPSFFCDAERNVDWVYGAGRCERIEALMPCYGPVVTAANFDRLAAALAEVEAVFSTWGMPILNAVQLDRLPRLRAVFFAAGSVQGFARQYLEKGIEVVSARAANGVPVAEFTAAQILLANKGYFRDIRKARRSGGQPTSARRASRPPWPCWARGRSDGESSNCSALSRCG